MFWNRQSKLESDVLCVLRVSFGLHSDGCPCHVIRKVKGVYKLSSNISHLETEIVGELVDCLEDKPIRKSGT